MLARPFQETAVMKSLVTLKATIMSSTAMTAAVFCSPDDAETTAVSADVLALILEETDPAVATNAELGPAVPGPTAPLVCAVAAADEILLALYSDDS